MGRENKEVGAMPMCYCLTFMFPVLSSQLSKLCNMCFQSCVSWTPLCIFSFCYVSNAEVSGTYPWVAVS